VDATLIDLESREIPSRILRQDCTVWKPDPRGIIDRLGWLTVPDFMGQQVDSLIAFAKDVKSKGVRHVVLLGMGGSSLGPEVLRSVFGTTLGYPELIILDSTVPDRVVSITNIIDPAHTLFLISSKSGETLETLTGYRHFRTIIDKALGEETAGGCFVAITDSDSPLDRIAKQESFLKVFTNPSTIGGLYSVLLYFGMVPAALTGIDVSLLLDRAARFRETISAKIPVEENPGVWLGAVIATLAAIGRDKLTLLTSPTLSNFGLWVEQLIAESLGKEGKGVIPIVGEPLLAKKHYGNDRLFIDLRLGDDGSSKPDSYVDELRAGGNPVIQLNLSDRYDIGREFYRWEYATAVAGAVMAVNPFDQPNVELSKDKTVEILKTYTGTGKMVSFETSSSLCGLLNQALPGDYLAILVYVEPTPEIDEALSDLRERIMIHSRIATTVGYGPRFLHSTGQLHKGGPPTGLYFQLTADSYQDINVPGAGYTFGA
ncbi:uncharacterized protein METZ01_LOCUS171621, partial [marine metagenome]